MPRSTGSSGRQRRLPNEKQCLLHRVPPLPFKMTVTKRAEFKLTLLPFFQINTHFGLKKKKCCGCPTKETNGVFGTSLLSLNRIKGQERNQQTKDTLQPSHSEQNWVNIKNLRQSYLLRQNSDKLHSSTICSLNLLESLFFVKANANRSDSFI